MAIWKRLNTCKAEVMQGICEERHTLEHVSILKSFKTIVAVMVVEQDKDTEDHFCCTVYCHWNAFHFSPTTRIHIQKWLQNEILFTHYGHMVPRYAKLRSMYDYALERDHDGEDGMACDIGLTVCVDNETQFEHIAQTAIKSLK